MAGPARALGSTFDEGVFIAFHGSWNRAPLPQAGYRVTWQPLRGGVPSGGYQTIMRGASDPTSVRPTGLAIGPDGSLYVAADANQTIWRILNTSGAARAGTAK